MAWNALPDDLRDPSLSADSFRKRLKTHLFRNALGHLAHSLRNALYKFKTYLLTYFMWLDAVSAGDVAKKTAEFCVAV